MRLFFLCFLFINLSWAQEEEPSISSQSLRGTSKGQVFGSYQPLSTWIPSKFGLSYTHIFNYKYSLEFDYAWSGVSANVYVVDFGSVSEKRFSLVMRHYVANSFHFIYGLFRNDLYARVGGDVFDSLSDQSFDYFRVLGTGVTLGLGSRWQANNGLSWGVDWIRMNTPILHRKVEDRILGNVGNASDRDDLKDVMRVIRNIPTFTLLGVSVGYSF